MTNQSGNQKSENLAAVADELNGIANRIRVMETANDVASAAAQSSLSRAKEHYKARRQRDKIFGDLQLFGEPVWDMLIDLFIATEEGRTVSITSLCMASGVPSTTALRWIGILEDHAIVQRRSDPTDARRFFLSLDDVFHEKFRVFFAQEF
jgi:DNA-binding MarR family transcriptional regulator